MGGKMTVNDRDRYDRTLLIIATENGVFDLVQFLINNGADIDAKTKNGNTAIDYAQGFNYPHIEKLLLFAKMNVEAGNDIKEISETIRGQNGINDTLRNELADIGKQSKQLYEETVMELMMRMVEKRKTFCDNQMIYAFNMAMTENEGILKSELWLQIRQTVSVIVQKGTKIDWMWLKICLLPSTIWYKDIAKDSEEPHYLYYELLKMVNV